MTSRCAAPAAALTLAALVGLACGQTKTWDGDAGTLNWKDGANWNPDGEPTTLDDVLVDASGPVLFQTGTLQFSGGFINTGLTLDSAGMALLGNLDVVDLIAQGCCTVNIETAEALTIRGNATEFFKALRLRGDGSTRLLGIATSHDEIRVDAHPLTIDGTLILLSTFGSLQTWNGGTVTINGTVVMNDGTDTEQINSGFIDNKGTIGIFSDGTATLRGDVRTNGGTLTATTGNLNCTGLYPFTNGRIEAHDTGFVDLFGSGDFDLSNVIFAGDGTVQWRNGTARIAGACTNDIQFPGSLVIRGITNLNGTLTNNGNMEWFGPTISGPGSITGPGFTTVTGATTLRVPTTISSGGSLDLKATLALEDELTVDAGGIVFVDQLASISDHPDGYISNFGIIKTGENNDPFDSVRVSTAVDLKPGGVLESLDGKLVFEGGGLWSGGSLRSGMSSDDTGLVLTGRPIIINGDVNLDGFVEIGNTLSPPDFGLYISGTLRITASNNDSVYLGADTTGPGMIVNEGSLILGQNAQLACAMLNSGDGIYINSSFVLAATLTNQATVYHHTGGISFDGGVIVNEGLWNIGSSASSLLPSADVAFVNSGTFAAVGSITPFTTDVLCGFDNSGTVRADNATISFADVSQIDAGILNGGTWITKNNGKILFPGSSIFTVFGNGTRVRGNDDDTPWARDIDDIIDAVFEATGDLTLDGQATVSGGRLDVIGGTTRLDGLDIRDGGVLGVGPDTRIESTNPVMLQSVIDVIEGVIDLALRPGAPGAINTPSLVCHGIIRPQGPDGPAELVFETVMTLTDTATVEIDIASDRHDAVTVVGSASLDGTLASSLFPGFEPPIGARFTVFTTTAGISGRFIGVTSPFFGPQGALRRLRPDYDATSLSLVVACAADVTSSGDPGNAGYGEPDGNVDATDFFYYLDQFAFTNFAEADITGSGDPGDPDYLIPDGNIDATDFFVFLDLFVQGCS